MRHMVQIPIYQQQMIGCRYPRNSVICQWGHLGDLGYNFCLGLLEPSLVVQLLPFSFLQYPCNCYYH
jgi:hypothetical protein